ncbi:MAG: glycosyltransferase 87 family protein [Nitrososphaerales archaeon]
MSYQNAFLSFDLIQFALLPVMAILVYRLIRKEKTIVISLVMLLMFQPWAFSYYFQWAQGQDKVFQTFLLLLSLYLGSIRKPFLSGVIFGLTFFDPRFPLLALPLFWLYNRSKLLAASVAAFCSLIISNSMLLYHGIFNDFVSMLLSYGIETPPYLYTLIPFFTIAALIAANARTFATTILGVVSSKNKR